MQVHQTPTVLLTRPRPASERFAKGLNVPVVIAPLMEIVGTGVPVDLDGVAGLILTSEAAVEFLPKTALPAYCVGPRTAKAARAAGMAAEVMGPDAEGLVKTLTERRPAGRLLHPHGTHTRGDVAGRLSAQGIGVTGVTVYDQKDIPAGAAFKAALAQPGLIVPLFSPRSARLFAEAAQDAASDVRIVALSPAVANTLPPHLQRQTHIAAAPTAEAMVTAMEPFGVTRNSP